MRFTSNNLYLTETLQPLVNKSDPRQFKSLLNTQGSPHIRPALVKVTQTDQTYQFLV